jgi:hypothetical protein
MCCIPVIPDSSEHNRVNRTAFKQQEQLREVKLHILTGQVGVDEHVDNLRCGERRRKQLDE